MRASATPVTRFFGRSTNRPGARHFSCVLINAQFGGPAFEEQQTSKRAAAQSVKLVRNALAVCCVERGTIYFRVARRHEVAQRRYALWPGATRRLPQVGPDQRLWAVRKCLFDRHNHHCRELLAVDSEAAPEVRIRTRCRNGPALSDELIWLSPDR